MPSILDSFCPPAAQGVEARDVAIDFIAALPLAPRCRIFAWMTWCEVNAVAAESWEILYVTNGSPRGFYANSKS